VSEVEAVAGLEKPAAQRRTRRSGGAAGIAAAAGASARDRIMDTAERLMAERGYAAVSVREIAAAAQVQFSGIGYHFGSKEMLLEAIFERRASALNGERAALLDACDPTLTGRPPSPEELLGAFCEPAFALARQAGGERFLRLQLLLFAEDGPLSRRIKARYYDPMSRRMVSLLGAALPGLPPEAIYLRFNFLVGALFATLRDQTRVQILSHGKVRIDPEATGRAFMAFLMSGFRGDLEAK
jgi:AcrR family transcriptional regulator